MKFFRCYKTYSEIRTKYGMAIILKNKWLAESKQPKQAKDPGSHGFKTGSLYPAHEIGIETHLIPGRLSV